MKAITLSFCFEICSGKQFWNNHIFSMESGQCLMVESLIASRAPLKVEMGFAYVKGQ